MHKTNTLALTHIYTYKHAPTDTHTHTHAHVLWLVGSGCSPAEWYCVVVCPAEDVCISLSSFSLTQLGSCI